MPGPAKGSIRLTQQHRDKISKSKILSRLIRHAEGVEPNMHQTEVTAAIALLKKVLPDLKYNENDNNHTGGVTLTTVYEGRGD